MSRSRPLTRFEIHPGIYKDSLVLMRLQSRLLDEPGILEAAATMASPANLDLLAEGGLLPEGLPDLEAQDLLIVVRAETEHAADAASARLAELLSQSGASASHSFRPHSLDGALSRLPEARWVLVSVPGVHASRVSEDALARGLNVFLFSDNVEPVEEIRLKQMAAARSLLLLGPDCGTAILAGTGLGFANRVRRGPIGLVGGSGTGLQAVSVALHALGTGVSQVIGTGGRDLSAAVGGVATRQGIQLLGDDPGTRVVALVSKSPDPSVAARALAAAAATGKPVVACLQGQRPDEVEGVHAVSSLAQVAPTAMRLAGISGKGSTADTGEPAPAAARDRGHLRGLFAGGTLAAEVLLGLEGRVGPLYSNLDGPWHRLTDPHLSRRHSVIDLGADELTRGRLHPMIDLRPRIERLLREAADEEVGVVLLDVILGDGAHADPASELAGAIERALEIARGRRLLEIVVLLLGTDEDPQDLDRQRRRLGAAGAIVTTGIGEAIERVTGRLIVGPEPSRAEPAEGLGATRRSESATAVEPLPAVPSSAIAPPLAAINVGLASFHACVLDQGATSIDLDWRPPAGGDERLTAILDRINRRGAAAQESRP